MRFEREAKMYTALFDDELILRCEERSRKSSTGLSCKLMPNQEPEARKIRADLIMFWQSR